MKEEMSMENEMNGKMQKDTASIINELCENETKRVDYFIKINDEISKYPFWKIEEIIRQQEFLIFLVNNKSTIIKIRYVLAPEMWPHIIYLLHQSISSYIKKRRVIRTRTKLDFFAKKSTLVIMIKPNHIK